MKQVNNSWCIVWLAGLSLCGTAHSMTVKVTTVSGFDEMDSPIPGEPFVDFDLGTNSAVALWDGMSSHDHPGFPGFPGGTWPTAIAPNSGSSTAILEQVSAGSGGTGYPASSSLYFGGTALGDVDGGVVRVYDASPVDDLNTVIFQLQMGEVFSFDFFQGQMPTLSYSGESGTVESLDADFQSIFGDISSPGYGPYIDASVYTYGFQWDLSTVSEDITDFWITMNPVQHAQIYGMQLDQGDLVAHSSLLPTAVPEPATGLIYLSALLAGVALRRPRVH
ncbi:hypothetical protein QEH59_15620 [Coraliomargarita sp. SDUM461004]|uniref:PEP-CTERM sorting domain-containing protein n=1 Tax=Thalassobacterium sedimentorum TaxID=3041258 RepID=A0ABU1AMC8_9BACT|nr:hypothetical protein [Coraliomargarita sp. SDUM461004]MDQ8195862.1 hypothetical protein [Coraliomargarita sp. SDUM461004]